MSAPAIDVATLELTPEEVRRRVMEFARGASAEITAHDEGLLAAIAHHLPAGTTLYIAHTPKASLGDLVRIALLVEALGFRAAPHIVARRIASERALREALLELADGGIEQVLLVAGDIEHPAGPFSSTLEVLETGLFEQIAFKRIGVAGHPQGHKAIGPTALWQALRAKQAFGERTGIKVHVVTQFGFDPQAVCLWTQHLGEHGVTLPVHVGLSGPTSLPKLIRFAMHCGVKTSLHSLMGNFSALSSLAHPATTPDEMLIGLIRGRIAHGPSPIVAPHFFSFGGAVATARYVRALVEGSFELEPQGNRFITSV